jgi:hypothetical protein
MKIALVLILLGVSAPASAAMMSAPMATTQYFPLIDGARYDYVFVSGPHATATAVVHASQTWGGIDGLASRHMTSTCRPSVPCAQDVTDFYRMDADGMRYFGGDADTPDDGHYTMMYASPEWVLKNPVIPGTMMGSGMYQGADSWQAAVSAMNSMMGPQSYMSTYKAEALETVTTPMGTFTNALHVREQRGSGYVRDVWYAAGVGMVRWMDADEEAVLAGVTMPTGRVPKVAMAVEYYHPALDHYFIAVAREDDHAEVDGLDTGKFGWRRTGLTFMVFDQADMVAGAMPVCRFYGNPAAGLNTHFYSASPEECALLHQNFSDQWLLELSNVFGVYVPDTTTGSCPAGTMPIYRTWNHRLDTNHRYTTDLRTQMAMMTSGSIAEGYGTPQVAMCAPQ